MGPSESAGKKVSAPTINTVPTSRPTKRGPCVGNVPLVTGTFFCRQTARRGQQRNQKQEAPDQHRQTERQVVPGRIGD